MEYIVAFIVMLCIAFIFGAFLAIPILIANARGVTGGTKNAIIILSIFGVFFGLTWFIALLMSLFCGGDSVGVDELDKLEKLAKLYKDKVITKAEYERMKSKLIRE